MRAKQIKKWLNDECQEECKSCGWVVAGGECGLFKVMLKEIAQAMEIEDRLP